MKLNLGNWHDEIGTTHENSPNREAPNRHNRGGKAYKEMISKDSKRLDNYGNLPFTFGKPKKSSQGRREVFVMCKNCCKTIAVTKNTCGYECRGCKSYVSVSSVNTFHTEEEYNELLKLFSSKEDE